MTTDTSGPSKYVIPMVVKLSPNPVIGFDWFASSAVATQLWAPVATQLWAPQKNAYRQWCVSGETSEALASGPSLRCYAHTFSLFLVKNLLSIHMMYYKADRKLVGYSSFKAPPTETVMCRYFSFEGAPNSNCNLKVICFQRGPQQPLK